MIKKFIAILLCILCFCLTGCIQEANRIYTVCKVDSEFMYCYSNEGKFFRVEEDGALTPISAVRLKELPALVLNPSEGDYKFYYQLPGLYHGTLESVNRYVTALGGTYEVAYRDWNNIETYVTSDNYSVRIIFNISGEVRIYCIDSDGKSIEPPLLEAQPKMENN